MSSQQILVVLGATGNQGGSVINTILADPKTKDRFLIRAVTRNTQSNKAKALTARGVECVEADTNSKASLVSAFAGAHTVWAVTNFWETGDAEQELRQGKNIADAAKEKDVQHLLWSSLLNVTKMTKGKFSGVSHFDSKSKVEEYIRSISVPATFILPGFYMDNFPGGFMRKNDQGTWVISLPIPGDASFPLFSPSTDTGKFVKAAILHRDELLGKRVLASTAYYTSVQMAEQFEVVEAGKAEFREIGAEEFKAGLAYGGMSGEAQEELSQNMQFLPEFGYYGGESLDESLQLLDEAPTTWKEFVQKSPAWNK